MTSDPLERPRPRRSWFERLAIGGAIGTAVIAVITAIALTVGYVLVTSRKVVTIENPAEAAAAAVGEAAAPAPPTTTIATTAPADDIATTTPPTDAAPETTTPATFPDADPQASNFLITGADNGACVDPDSPYAAAFGDREGMGERSDTIMMFRVDPATSRVAVLSFPRDLYVDIAGSGSKARINSAFRRDEPQRLIDTIYDNFGIVTDHFIQIDFCAFKTLVNAVGGVSVPFQYPARDPNTGLNVPTTGCFTFDGEHALAYVRSRHYEYENPAGSGDWESDETSDLGRISRQQDFIRRVLARVLSQGPLNPSVAGGLIEAAQNYVVTDNELSPAKLLEFAGVLNDVEPGLIPTYQIEASSREVNGAEVLEPEIEGENMEQILDLFRGQTSLGAAPRQTLSTTTTVAPHAAAGDDAGAATVGTDGTESTDDGTVPAASRSGDDPSATTVVPIPGAPVENALGIVPPRDITC